MDDHSETYTVQEAARVLKRTPEAIGRMLQSGELSGEHEDGDERKPWRVHKWSAHVLRDGLREDRPTTRTRARPQEPNERPREPAVAPPNRFGYGTSDMRCSAWNTAWSFRSGRRAPCARSWRESTGLWRRSGHGPTPKGSGRKGLGASSRLSALERVMNL